MSIPQDIHADFIERIKQAAIAAGTTPQAACVLGGRTEATWYHWRNGETSPTARDLMRILEAIENYKLVKAEAAR